jgi:hypothetical protein
MTISRFCAAFLLLALLPAVQAEELHIALYAQRDEATLRSGGADVETDTGRLGVTLTGIYSPYVDANLDVAHVSLTQTGNPATQGMSLGGQYGGVTLRFWPLRSGHLDGWVQGDYSAQSVSGSNNGQNTKLDWYDSGVSAGLVLRMGAVDLHGGARYGNLSGDEIASGTLVHTRSISVENKTTSWVGADLYVDRSGTIGIIYDSGGRRGLSVRFARRF